MAVERMNTSQFKLMPVGHYSLRVVDEPVKRYSEKSTYRIWKFATEKGQQFSTVFFPWMAEELILALGGTKEGDEVVWDPETVAGKWIECDLIHEAEKSGKMRERMLNITPLQTQQYQPTTQRQTQEEKPHQASAVDVGWE